MIKLVKSIWRKIKSIFGHEFKPEYTETVKKLQNRPHSCALTALAMVIPDLSYDQIFEAFCICCDKWPNAGVTNKEFNIVLSYLGIIKCFKYNDSNNLTVNKFYKENAECTIILIHGHFTVLHQKNIYDNYDIRLDGNTKVYASWSLIS